MFNNSTGITPAELDAMIEDLQDISYNQGGIFCFYTIENPGNADALTSIIELLSDREQLEHLSPNAFGALQNDIKDLHLVLVNDWKELTQQKLKEWLYHFTSYSPEKVDEERLDHRSSEFFQSLSQYLQNTGLKDTYYIDEKFNNYYTPWGDQMSFDIVFRIKDRIHILHFGWSS